MAKKYQNIKDYRNSWYALSTNRLIMTQGRLQGDVSCDVCIVGGGLTGLSAALELCKKGYSVVLLEGKELASAATGRNGGHLRRGFEMTPGKLIAKYGIDDARALCNMTLEGIALILQRITAHDIKCDLKFGVLTAARKPRHETALKRERDAWEKLGHTDMEYLPKSRVQKLVSAKQYLGGLLDPKGAHFHPLNYALGVAQAAQKLGCKLHDDTYATQIVMQPAPKVITAEGTVNAKFIIIAGSVKIPGIIGNLQAKTLTTTAHMISTEPMDSTRARNLIPGDIAVGDARHFMDYYRFSGNHCLLFGGTHNYTGWESGSEDQALRKRMLSLFPSLGTTRIDHFWSTPMEFTFDRLPHIGKLSPQVFYAHGFGGHGLIAANVAGKVLAEAVSGTAEKFDVFAKIQHLTIPGGACVKRPLFLLMAAWHRVMDVLP